MQTAITFFFFFFKVFRKRKLAHNDMRPEWKGKAFKNKNPSKTSPLGQLFL